MFGFSTSELMIAGVVVLLLFGSRLPSAMRNLGMSVNSFKKGIKDGEEEAKRGNIESDEEET